ncbi:MAG TPA: sugar phosphate isomerase/epimerase [Chitinophagaceae bacterium]|jgi:sugar phosphate isomerase/epimerase|nr:sugar phosphate isomerase/epimerase [Chitinophagaceae bacterium]
MKNIRVMIIWIMAILIHETGLAQKPLYTAPLGIQTYTFRRSIGIDPAKTLDTIKRMGFIEIEGGGANPEMFRKLCDERGISIPSTGASYEQLVRSPDSVVWRAKILGAEYVMCSWVPHDNGVLSFENAKKAVEDFNAAGKILKENGLTFCYHTHGYEFQPYEKGTLLDYIINNTNPEYVSFEMDVFWIQFGGGNPTELLKKYGNRWKLMHLKDMRKGTKKDLTGLTSTENDVALGTGEIDIVSILKQAKKVGIKHYFIEDESNNIITQVPQSIAYLKSLKE